MTLDAFLIPCSTVLVSREARQRREVVTDDLESSIARLGVLNPIIVDGENRLIAGERRLAACIALGHEFIPARRLAALTPHEVELAELDENVRRKDLSWQEYTFALVRIHEILVASHENWSVEKTAAEIGYNLGDLYKRIVVAKLLRAEPQRFAKVDSFNTAYNIHRRAVERRAADALATIGEIRHDHRDDSGADNCDLGSANADTRDDADDFEEREENFEIGNGLRGPSGALQPSHSSSSLSRNPEARSDNSHVESVILADFTRWAGAYAGPSFNFIHCDFPYGIGVFAGNMSGRHAHGDSIYDDSYESYERCCNALFANLDALLGHSGHLMFWFSMEHYERTMRMFVERAPVLSVQKFPLIWTKTDNAGIAPDPKRQPRRVYETALIATREDRPLVQMVANWYGCATDKTLHHSCKPEPMLRHFFRMFVDSGTRMLDPTCGSGSALRAAESLGAQQVLGLEVHEEHATNARRTLAEFRVKRQLSEKTR